MHIWHYTIQCRLYKCLDTKIISEYWNKDIRNYLDAMGGFEPQFIGINYMYSSLIEKDKKKAQSYLKKFEQIKKNHHNKNSVKETEKTILVVNERLDKDFEKIK